MTASRSNDLVTYNDKHNEANGEDNHDGSSDNRSWNCGAEGPTTIRRSIALRERQMRNMLATLLLSQGTPMMLAGDEFGRTQQGNNNAYCQDNEISWLDWDLAEKGQSLIRFVQKLTALRHKYPDPAPQPLPDRRLQRGARRQGRDLDQRHGAEMTQEEWGDQDMRCFGMLMDGRAQATGIRQRGEDATLLMILNAYHDLVKFALPKAAEGTGWSLLIDTNAADDDAEGKFEVGEAYDVTARSLLLFSLE